MKVIDAFWEINNIGKKTIEIFIDDESEINEGFLNIIYNYEYIVVKVPVGKFLIIKKLENLGFNFIETMMTLTATVDDLQKALGNNGIKIYDKLSYIIDNGEEAICQVIEQIKKGMFNSDRISLDNEFGEQVAQNRYMNWIKNSILDGTNKLVLIRYVNDVIGFTMYNESESVIFPLAGIYEEYRGMKLGSSIIYTQMQIMKKLKKNLYGQISSNNIPSLRVHIKSGYNIDNAFNVFIKHI